MQRADPLTVKRSNDVSSQGERFLRAQTHHSSAGSDTSVVSQTAICHLLHQKALPQKESEEGRQFRCNLGAAKAEARAVRVAHRQQVRD